VFEDPEVQPLWLAKGTPRSWLKTLREYQFQVLPPNGSSQLLAPVAAWRGAGGSRSGAPLSPFAAAVKIRLRVPEGNRIRSVTLNGKG